MTILKQGYRILHLTDLNFVKEDMPVINNLITQLSSQANSGEDLNFQSFLSIINEENTHIFAVRRKIEDKNVIVGIAKVHFHRQLVAGMVGYVSDVVVDVNERGKGIGKALNTAIINIARSHKANYLELTSNSSNPDRGPAVKLYKLLGYAKSETDVYRLNLAMLK